MILINMFNDIKLVQIKEHVELLEKLLGPISTPNGLGYTIKYIDSMADYGKTPELEEDWESIGFFDKEKIFEIVVNSEENGAVLYIPSVLVSLNLDTKLKKLDSENKISYY